MKKKSPLKIFFVDVEPISQNGCANESEFSCVVCIIVTFELNSPIRWNHPKKGTHRIIILSNLVVFLAKFEQQ